MLDVDEQPVDTQDHSAAAPEKDLKMSNVLLNMYGSGKIDQKNVTIASSFITLLHLANEEQLYFKEEGLKDFIICQGGE